ncbi:YciI family protein [Niabella pedocola]|uniref:YciI family protein n=1 Tax=Niabella pedocola TaxID=1752077 RepID=A0ABS8PXF3_9BACT|nr:YciI family protein [Niabella pedocola]MCD2425509.1 YciI family protein [Niabella pedocola]
MDKQQFYLKLNPPRPTFMADMTAGEKATMQQHVAYWAQLLQQGIAIVFGPVADPKGGYGVGVVSVDDEAHLKKIIEADPANGLNQYEYYPMRAVFKQG